MHILSLSWVQRTYNATMGLKSLKNITSSPCEQVSRDKEVTTCLNFGFTKKKDIAIDTKLNVCSENQGADQLRGYSMAFLLAYTKTGLLMVRLMYSCN